MGWLKNKNREASSRLTEALVMSMAAEHVTEKLETATERMKADTARMKAERAAKKAAKKVSKES